MPTAALFGPAPSTAAAATPSVVWLLIKGCPRGTRTPLFGRLPPQAAAAGSGVFSARPILLASSLPLRWLSSGHLAALSLAPRRRPLPARNRHARADDVDLHGIGTREVASSANHLRCANSDLHPVAPSLAVSVRAGLASGGRSTAGSGTRSGCPPDRRGVPSGSGGVRPAEELRPLPAGAAACGDRPGRRGPDRQLPCP
jgi:hypothetical protein